MEKAKMERIIEIYKKHTLIEELIELEERVSRFEDPYSHLEVQIIAPHSKFPLIKQEIATDSLQTLIKDKVIVLKEEMEIILSQIAVREEVFGREIYRL